MTGARGRIPLWVDLRHVPVNKRLPYWKAVQSARADRVVLGTDDPHLDRKGIATVRLDGNHALKDGKKALGRHIIVRGGKDQERAADADGIVLVEGDDWTVIPLENLIAARRDRPGTLFALARDLDDLRLFRDTLEIGVHGVALVPSKPADVEEADRFLRERGPRRDDAIAATAPAGRAGEAGDGRRAGRGRGGAKTRGSATEARPDEPLEAPRGFLVPGRISRIEDAGPGDRVCIDATSLFRDGEGLLIGSTARGFCLVHAETIESEYVRARPFRVNAGAVHSYLFAPGGKTRYLSELASGDHVLAVHPDGIHRVLTIGRAKVERRPHTLIGWKTEGGDEGHAVLQTAETIRLVRADGTPVAVTDLERGDLVLVHTETAARHFGMAVDEFLEER